MYVDDFADDQQLKLCHVTPGNEKFALVTRVYVNQEQVQFSYACVYNEDGFSQNTDREKTTFIKNFAEVPLRIIEMLTRFNVRFDAWAKGNNQSDCLYFDETEVKTFEVTT